MSASIDAVENDIFSSSQSKKEFIQGTIKGSILSKVDRIGLQVIIEDEAFRGFASLGFDVDLLNENYELIKSSAERIVLGAENEIHIELKRTWLSENIKKNHNSGHGEFFNAYQDLTSIFATEYPQFTDLVKMAYGYARIELGAVLLLQGILSDSEFNDEIKLFPDVDVKQFIDLDSSPDYDSIEDQANTAACDYLSTYDFGSVGYDTDYFSCRFALVFVFDRKITSNMVGSAHRSQLEVMQLLDKLLDLSITEDFFSPDDYCGLKNIYEYLLGSNEFGDGV